MRAPRWDGIHRDDLAQHVVVPHGGEGGAGLHVVEHDVPSRHRAEDRRWAAEMVAIEARYGRLMDGPAAN